MCFRPNHVIYADRIIPIPVNPDVDVDGTDLKGFAMFVNSQKRSQIHRRSVLTTCSVLVGDYVRCGAMRSGQCGEMEGEERAGASSSALSSEFG